MGKLVTIIIPNFRTEELTRLCLNNLLKCTDPNKAEIIVVDNDSRDGSVKYLRTLVPQIILLERRTTGESAAKMHAVALDYALRQVTTPYTLVMHTDTIILKSGWLEFLLGKIEAAPNIAAVGSWKLEKTSALKEFGKKTENLLRGWLGRKILDREHYLRSHCALYKTDLLKKTSGFFAGESAGIVVFRELKAAGHRMDFIESKELTKYMVHLNHATLILNPVPGKHKTNSPRARAKLDKQLNSLAIK